MLDAGHGKAKQVPGTAQKPDEPRVQRPIIFAVVVLIVGILIWGMLGIWVDGYFNNLEKSQVGSIIHTKSGDIAILINDRLQTLNKLDAFYLMTHGQNDSVSDTFPGIAPRIMTDPRQSGIISMGFFDGDNQFIEYPSHPENQERYRQLLYHPPSKFPDKTATAPMQSPHIILSTPATFQDGVWGLMASKEIPGITNNAASTFIILNLDALFAQANLNADSGDPNNLEIAIRTESGDILYGNPGVFSVQPVTEEILLYPQKWEIGAVPRDGWRSLTLIPRLMYIFGGLLIVLLSALITYTMVDRHEQLMVLVNKRTHELDTRNKDLEIEIVQRQKAEHTAQAANTKLNLLYAITRHDILNQLTALQGYLHLLILKGDIDQKSKDYIAHGLMAAEVIAEQITFTKDYEELGVSAPQWQDVQATINQATAGFKKVSFRIDDLNGLEVYADALLGKVFYNLAENAIRHGEQVTEIQVHCKTRGDSLLLIWSDNGVGIPVEMKTTIFERGVGKHTGLGMFLVREILLISGITITENGEPGTGARFEILLPKGVYRYHAQE